MSKGIKKVASIALPIAATFVLGPAGLGVMSAGMAGALGGAAGGLISGGGLRGAALGALTGYASSGLNNALIGSAAQAAPAAGTAAAAGAKALGVSGATAGSGILGAVTGGGMRALGAGVSSAASSALNSAGIISAGNQIFAQGAADDAKKAAEIQAAAIDRATATQQPYNQLGTAAAQQIQQIQADPAAYIQNNKFYQSLADDAQRRLLASEASKGKVASGGTAAALQDQMLQLGNGLVQQQVNSLQNQVNSGQNAANNVSGLQTDKGAVKASGVIGAGNALSTGYQNQLDSLLALRNAQTYQPSQTYRR